MEKATSTMLVVLVIGALVGAGGAYYYMQPQIDSAFDQGSAYGQSIGAQSVVVTAPDITVDWDVSDTWDFNAVIDADGDVTADTSAMDTIVIENTGDVDIAGLYISLQDPQTNDGLPDELENKYFWIYMDYGAVTGINLYEDAEYRAGYNLGSLPAGATMEVDVYIGVLENTKGLFEDGETYDECVFYLYAAGSAAKELEFTVIT
jgi:hypothetical protein